jgi:hypothetical protein
MTARRELTQAVVEAARYFLSHDICHQPAGLPTCDGIPPLKAAMFSLDACTEPDLAALDAAVAEAVEAYFRASPIVLVTNQYSDGKWVSVVDAVKARRAALKPRARYTVDPNSTLPVRVTVYDTHESRPLSPPEVAALLNEKEAAK